MALQIKNTRVEALVEEITALTGETKTEAIRRALEERRARLAHGPSSENRRARLLRFLEQEVWPVIPRSELGRRISKAQEERILGYDREGVRGRQWESRP